MELCGIGAPGATYSNPSGHLHRVEVLLPIGERAKNQCHCRARHVQYGKLSLSGTDGKPVQRPDVLRRQDPIESG